MPTVVGIRFRKACKIYYFDPVDTGVVKGDHAIVETARGVEYGSVVLGPREVANTSQPLKPVIRKATPEDDAKVSENAVREQEAFHICERRIKAHELAMNLVDVEFTYDVNKIIFYFTADGRIDFRELVKDLAGIFRTRIELHQIGVRDEAKMLGGLGCCGRPLCCATFLGDFEPVSIKMAKNQNLSLNPTKISGICGRLMCCLKYEDYLYSKGSRKEESQDEAPKIGADVVSPLGDGKVIRVDRRERTASIQLTPDNVVTVSWDEIVDPQETAEDKAIVAKKNQPAPNGENAESCGANCQACAMHQHGKNDNKEFHKEGFHKNQHNGSNQQQGRNNNRRQGQQDHHNNNRQQDNKDGIIAKELTPEDMERQERMRKERKERKERRRQQRQQERMQGKDNKPQGQNQVPNQNQNTNPSPTPAPVAEEIVPKP
jgi:cell fate regulator YaaT (PSP1 superfamily)